MFSAGVADGEAAMLPGRGPAMPLSALDAEACSQPVFESLSSVSEVRVREMCQSQFPSELENLCVRSHWLNMVGRGVQVYTVYRHSGREFLAYNCWHGSRSKIPQGSLEPLPDACALRKHNVCEVQASKLAPCFCRLRCALMRAYARSGCFL